MVMFDQQPMGPVPARRPIMIPPDPELEALMSDPGSAQVELVGPVPMELREPLPGLRRPAAWRRLRWVLAVLLVVPTFFNLISAAQYALGTGAEDLLARLPRLIAAAVLLVILLVAALLVRSRAKLSANG